MVDLIGATTTRAGLTVHAERDTGSYPKGIKVSDQELAAILASSRMPSTASGTTASLPPTRGTRRCSYGNVIPRAMLDDVAEAPPPRARRRAARGKRCMVRRAGLRGPGTGTGT